MIDRASREPLLRRLGLAPPAGDLIREALAAAVGWAEARHDAARAPRPAVTALDAGCGGRSALASFRPRLVRLVGVDVHRPPGGAPPALDAFVVADVCRSGTAFGPATFDVVLCSFAVEHLADPRAALANLARWLRPGGTLVLATVNRRHPFVAAYLRLPDCARRRLQPVVKATAADAHPLVGVCNDPAALRAALAAAGFAGVELRTVDNLARAWGRHRLTFALGVVGDLLARGRPSRRSTIVVTARTPADDPDPSALSS